MQDRKFVYERAHTAEQALDGAFSPSRLADDVLLHVPVATSEHAVALRAQCVYNKSAIR
jgi:hypothetical protein